VFSESYATRDQVTDLLDTIGPDWDWHAPLPHCVLFTSPLSAQELADKFEKQFGHGGGKIFLITEVPANKQGRLTDRGWRVLNNPENPRAK
jgi:hypothetical protein